MSKFRAPLIILLVNCCLSSTAYTCEYTVRDTGFVQIYDTPYRLFGYIGKDTPRDVVSTLKQISAVVLMDSNVEFSLINIDQDKGHRAMEYLRRWEINSLPGLILVAPDGRSLPLSITTTDKSFKEQLWTKLEQIVESPKRDEMLAHIVKSYCVIVLVEGKEASTNKKVRETALNATEQIKQHMGQITKPIEAPPRLVVINSDNLAQENVLLWSLGINPEEINDPYLAVLYGRG
ncbi:MAG: hypothetical protein JSV03_08000, partial [Planctomycetota bacterium]